MSAANLSHAAMALSAAHHDHDHRGGLESHKVPPIAFDMYINAISESRQTLARLSEEHAVWTGLIISFMLAGVEALRDRPENAGMHLTNGLKVAFSVESNTISQRPILRSDCNIIEESTEMIKRLKGKLSGLMGGRGDMRHIDPVNTARQGMKLAFHTLVDYVDHLADIVDEPSVLPCDIQGILAQLEVWDSRLAQLVPNPFETVLYEFQLVKVCREAVCLLLLAKLFFSMANHQVNPSCLLELAAYLSKLVMLETQMNSNKQHVVHLTPAQLKFLAARHGLISLKANSNGLKQSPTPTLHQALERLVMQEESAIRNSGLVPPQAMCMDITSALDKGSVSIRYCLLDQNGSFIWVERRALIWKAAIFRQTTVKPPKFT